MTLCKDFLHKPCSVTHCITSNTRRPNTSGTLSLAGKDHGSLSNVNTLPQRSGTIVTFDLWDRITSGDKYSISCKRPFGTSTPGVIFTYRDSPASHTKVSTRPVNHSLSCSVIEPPPCTRNSAKGSAPLCFTAFRKFLTSRFNGPGDISGSPQCQAPGVPGVHHDRAGGPPRR